MGARERAATLDGLKASQGYLQARVNDALRMKRTPQLVFVYDETTDKAMRMERLLHREAEVLGQEPPDFGDPEGQGEPAPDPAGDGGEDEA